MHEQAKIVIIGGGIAGCSALYHLAQMGCTDVLLLERDELTSGSTWHAAGNVPTYSTSWSVMKVQSYSAALYRELANDTDCVRGLERACIEAGDLKAAGAIHVERTATAATILGRAHTARMASIPRCADY